MEIFGNRYISQHTNSECRNRLEIGQRTKKIRNNGTKIKIHDMKRHKQLRGSHKVLTIFFLQFCMYAEQVKNILIRIRS